jgi:hypothetical protein
MQRRQIGDEPDIGMIHSKVPGGLTNPHDVERPADVAIHLFDRELMVDNAIGNGATYFAKGDPAAPLTAWQHLSKAIWEHGFETPGETYIYVYIPDRSRTASVL